MSTVKTSSGTPLVERSTTRKVVGSLAILGTAAAVAGLGTYGNFTDSTTPMNTTVDTGSLSINLTQPAGAVAIPVSTTGFVPGDSMTRAVNLINDGAADLGSVTLTAQVTSVANVLTTDAVNGLQLSVKGCSVAWTQGGTPTAPTYACSGTERSVLTTAVANAGSSVPLTSPASLAAGGVDNLIFSISLPTSAGNTFQGKSATLSLTFTGVQRAGTAR
ncbi:MAG TPA: TasA family protein [Micromonosporaceae bacterium]|nr:TasA family protein [Micromonosporaceae bacterium]